MNLHSEGSGGGVLPPQVTSANRSACITHHHLSSIFQAEELPGNAGKKAAGFRHGIQALGVRERVSPTIPIKASCFGYKFLDQCGELEVATVSSPPALHID